MAEKRSKIIINPELINKLLPIFLIATIALAFLVGVLWQKVQTLEKNGPVYGSKEAAQPTPRSYTKLTDDQAKKIPQVSDKDHIKGDSKAKAFLIVYSDFECPFCKQFHPTINQIFEQYKGDIALVYRQFPLISIHPKAQPSAEASECVASLGGNDAFWKFVDLAFEGAPQSLDDLPTLAQNSGINKAAFQKCFNENRFKGLVDSQSAGGSAAGVTGTPGNFIVTDKGAAWSVPGAVSSVSLKQAIDEALASR